MRRPTPSAEGSRYVSSPDPASDWVEVPEDYLDRLPSIEEDLAGVARPPGPWILVAHSPPWGAVDTTTSGHRAGSRALRRWIADRAPLLALHGHVHEAPDAGGTWAERVGLTVCVNPGAAGDDGLRAVIGEIRDGALSLRHTTRGVFRTGEPLTGSERPPLC
jgi:Icc-related predicted phosphoesterase